MASFKKDPEYEVIGKLIEALDGQDPELQARVLNWAAARYGVTLSGKKSSDGTKDVLDDDDKRDAPEFGEVGDLVSAAAPSTDEDRALVVAYWFQELQEEKQPHVTGAQVNKALKNLGHGSSAINKVFDSLIGTSPQQVIQTRKSGSSRQARKNYKVTRAGIKRVQELLDALS